MTSTLYSMMKNQGSIADSLKENVCQNEVKLDDAAEDDYICNMLNISNDEEPIDAEQKKRVGEKAIHNFYQHYKGLNKVCDQNSTCKVKDSVYTGMLNYCETKKILPSKCGVIKTSGSSKTLNLSNYMLGGKYMGIVAEGIRRTDYDIIDCRNNRLRPTGAKRLIDAFKYTHKDINLSKNRLGRSTNLLNPILTAPDTRLQYLNLDKNYIGDFAGNELLVTLVSNKNLKSLHLNDNQFTDKIADKLADLLFNHNNLAEIYLRWNSLTSLGGKKIFNV
jgi:spore coat protein CotF